MTSSTFDLKAFLERSRALDLSGIDWGAARRHPVSEAERRILPYFIDVEAYTIGYLRALLNTSAIHDVEVGDFLACWVYEESYHGRALERFLEAAGHGLDPARRRSIQKPRGLLEAAQDAAATALSTAIGKDFTAVHMTWGAIQELTTLNGYRRMAAKSANPVLAEIIRRIMRDESRHFSFYYHQAELRLDRSPFARRLVPAIVNRFWKPVGAGIMPNAELDYLIGYLFGDEEGLAEARHVDATLSRLPGMSGFRGLGGWMEETVLRLQGAARSPEAVAA